MKKSHCMSCGFSIMADPELIDLLHEVKFFCPGCPLSHVATVDVEIKDLPALKAAAARLGLEFVEGQQTYNWFGKHMGDYPCPEGFTPADLGKCEHAIRIPPGTVIPGVDPRTKPYEIGVVKRRDGRPGYTLLWDFWCEGLGLQHFVGKDCVKLKQAYATEVAKRAAIAKGFRVTEQQRQDGLIRLIASK